MIFEFLYCLGYVLYLYKTMSSHEALEKYRPYEFKNSRMDDYTKVYHFSLFRFLQTFIVASVYSLLWPVLILFE